MTVRNRIIRWSVRGVIGLLFVVPWVLVATLYFKNDDLRRFLRHEMKESRCMADAFKLFEKRAIDYENKWRALRWAFGAESGRVWDAIHDVMRTNEICSSQMSFESLALCELCFAAMRHRMLEGFSVDGEEIVEQKDRPHFRRWRDAGGSVYDLSISTNGAYLLNLEVRRPSKDL